MKWSMAFTAVVLYGHPAQEAALRWQPLAQLMQSVLGNLAYTGA